MEFKPEFFDVPKKMKKVRATICGVFFSKDGNRGYKVLGNEIEEYDLSISFDWRTAIYVGKIGWAI